MTCKKAIGVATVMKESYGERLELKMFTSDSEEAKGYHFKGSTNVLFDKESIPIDIATDVDKMDAFLSQKL